MTHSQRYTPIIMQANCISAHPTPVSCDHITLHYFLLNIYCLNTLFLFDLFVEKSPPCKGTVSFLQRTLVTTKQSVTKLDQTANTLDGRKFIVTLPNERRGQLETRLSRGTRWVGKDVKLTIFHMMHLDK